MHVEFLQDDFRDMITGYVQLLWNRQHCSTIPSPRTRKSSHQAEFAPPSRYEEIPFDKPGTSS
jgi:hypothetical protein